MGTVERITRENEVKYSLGKDNFLTPSNINQTVVKSRKKRKIKK